MPHPDLRQIRIGDAVEQFRSSVRLNRWEKSQLIQALRALTTQYPEIETLADLAQLTAERVSATKGIGGRRLQILDIFLESFGGWGFWHDHIPHDLETRMACVLRETERQADFHLSEDSRARIINAGLRAYPKGRLRTSPRHLREWAEGALRYFLQKNYPEEPAGYLPWTEL